MKTPREIRSAIERDAGNNGRSGGDADSDVVSFWLLLLFIATFFGIAAEEARRPTMFQSTSTSAAQSAAHPIAFNLDGTPLPKGAGDERTSMARRFDLSSVDPETAHLNVPGKLEIPATGK